MEEETICCQRCDIIKSVFNFGDDDDYRYCNACYPAVQAEWNEREAQRLVSRAAHLGFSVEQMKFIEGLEWRITQLQDQLSRHIDREA